MILNMQYRRYPVHLSGKRWIGDPELQFVTVCAKDRKKILARPDVFELVLGAWCKADAWTVGRYIVLPDHIHFFAAPVREGFTLTQWMKFWRSDVSRRWPRPEEQPVWQQQFWDVQVRAGHSYDDKWEYVRHNAMRHGLVESPEDWPYQGELTVLEGPRGPLE